MSIRVDSSSLISGAVVVGVPGLGVLAENIPTTGEHGGGIAATWLVPEDAGKEVRVLVTTWPAAGTLFVFEDTSFEYDGPSTSFEAQLYLDGVAVGTPQPVMFTVGAGTTVSPSACSITSTGYAPSIQQPITLSPAAGSVIATGYAPQISQISSVRPSTGRVASTGHAPAISQPRTVSPATGHALLTGYAPIIVSGVRIAPEAGHVVASGYVPTITQGGARLVSPMTGHAVWQGYAPAINPADDVYPSYRTITVPSGRTIRLGA